MRCLHCQQDNPPEASFCNACGTRLELRCAGCGHTNNLGSRFCNQCGRTLAPEPVVPVAPDATLRSERPRADYTPKHLANRILKERSALEGERRQVTVLFADIAGFTPLAERLDPEDVHQIIDQCF